MVTTGETCKSSIYNPVRYWIKTKNTTKMYLLLPLHSIGGPSTKKNQLNEE